MPSDIPPQLIDQPQQLKDKLDLTTRAIQEEFYEAVAGVFVMGSITKEATPTSDLDVVVVYDDGYFQKNFTEIKPKLNRIADEINRVLPEHELVLWASKNDHYRTLLPDISYLRANLPSTTDRLDAWCGLAKHTLLNYEASSHTTILGDFTVNATKLIMLNEAGELFLLSTRTLAEGITELTSGEARVRRAGINHVAKSGLRAVYAVLLRKDQQPRNSYFDIWQESLRLVSPQHHQIVTHLYEVKSGKRSDLMSTQSLLEFLRYCEMEIADAPSLEMTGLSRDRTGAEAFAFPSDLLFKTSAPVSEYCRFLGFHRSFLNSLYFLMSSEAIAWRLISAGISDLNVLDFYYEELMAVVSVASMSPGGVHLVVGRNERHEINLELGLKLLQGLAPRLQELASHYLNAEHDQFSRPWLSLQTKLARLFVVLQILSNVPDVLVSEHLIEELGKRVNSDCLSEAVLWECFLFRGIYSEAILEHFSNIALKLAQAGGVDLAQRILESVLLVNQTKEDAARELGHSDEARISFDQKLSRATQYYAVTFHRQGQFAKAKEQYLKSLALDPNNYSAIDDLTQLLLEHGPGPEMTELLEGLLAHFTTNKAEGRRQVSARFVSHAIDLKQRGNINEALTWYLHSIQVDPQYEKAHYNLALLYEKTKDLDRAEESYRKAIALNVNYTHAYVNLAMLQERKQDYDAAIGILSDAVNRGIADEKLFANLANNYLFRGELEAAKANYQKALAVNGNHADALNGMGAILLQGEKEPDLNSLVLAASYFQKALESDPTFEGAKANYYHALAKIYALPGSSFDV